jgi:hypothetical protein
LQRLGLAVDFEKEIAFIFLPKNAECFYVEHAPIIGFVIN